MAFKHFRSLVAACIVVIAAAVPSPASAALLATSATNCQAQSSSQVFLPFTDPAYYTLQPGGDFEPGSPDWDVTAGASDAAVNEPWSITDEMDGHSLALNSGSSATSGSICVGVENPTIRFFTRASSTVATLQVEVLYLDGNGVQQSLQIATIMGSLGWSPTPQIPIVANLLPLLPDGKTPVAFRLTATSGNWKVDDFYVDPLQRW